MKPSGDLILPTERRRKAFYLLRSHWAAIATLPSSTVDPSGSPADRHMKADVVERVPLLDNAKAVLLLGVISWHHARCGESDHCMPGYLPELIGANAGLLNRIPKALGSSSLSGLMILAGVVHGKRTHQPPLWEDVGRTILPGLLVHFVLAPVFDNSCVHSTIPTNGHVWFLYSVALAKLVVHLVGLCGGAQPAMLLVPLALSLVAPVVWHAIFAAAPALSGARYEGLTWSSGEWFVPIGVRNVTYIVFFAFGIVACPLPRLIFWRRHCDAHLSSRACVWAVTACCTAYSVTRLQLGSTNMFLSADLGVWVARLPRQLEMLVISAFSPLALVMLLPAGRVAFLTYAGASTLTPYLLHPLALKVVRPWVGRAVSALTPREAAPADCALLILLEHIVVPPAMLGVLACLGNGLHCLLHAVKARVPAAKQSLGVGALVLAAIAASLLAASAPAAPASPALDRHSSLLTSSGLRGGTLNLTMQNGPAVHAAGASSADVYVRQQPPRTRPFHAHHSVHALLDSRCPCVRAALPAARHRLHPGTGRGFERVGHSDGRRLQSEAVPWCRDAPRDPLLLLRRCAPRANTRALALVALALPLRTHAFHPQV